MIEIRNNNIYRGIKRIGYIIDKRIYDDSTKMLCTVSEDTDTVYDASGRKLVHIQGNVVYDAVTGRTIDLDDSIQSITAVGLSDIFHVAISMFFGEGEEKR
ncbi:MAG: hypothetical protein PHW52_04500 [Candidatus Pacebacteria bacterium]|nr:hypothetical protein [Candidatus Paceibacterota bacterium]